MEEKTAKEISVEQEDRIAKMFGGSRTPRSGGGSWKHGDVLSEDWFIECKTTVKPSLSYSINKEVLDKMEHERAEMQKLFSALSFTLGEAREDYFVVNKRTMLELLEIISDIKKLKNTTEKALASLDDKYHQLRALDKLGQLEAAQYTAHKEELRAFLEQLQRII